MDALEHHVSSSSPSDSHLHLDLSCPRSLPLPFPPFPSCTQHSPGAPAKGCRVTSTMMNLFALALLAVLFYACKVQGAASVSSLGSGVRFLYQNDLDWARANSAARQAGYLILTTPLTAQDAASKCTALNEALAPTSALSDAGLQAQMSYALFERSYAGGQSFWVADRRAFVVTAGNDGKAAIALSQTSVETKLPALCTQSAPWNFANHTDTSAQWQVATSSNGVQFNGFRDALSFRFQALPYANPTQRFTYSSVYDGRSTDNYSISALEQTRAKQCPQLGSDTAYTEECQVANVFTPYLPSASDLSNGKPLKPVFVFVHGGGYRSGSGLDFTFDGGNMASRSDVVVVTFNYRLGTLGYLAYNDQIRGNYGLGDVVTMLRWVQKYIKEFGGDPNKVTVGGQSAGAQHVESLLASPAAAGLFQRAMIFSGAAHDNAFVYPTIQQARQGAAGNVVKSLGCDTASDLLDCLRGKSISSFLQNAYTSIVQDGTFIQSPKLDMRPASRASGHVNRVPVMWGTLRDEQASFHMPNPGETDFVNAMKQVGIQSNYSDIVLRDTNTFPVNDYGVRNMTNTIKTDIYIRCGIQAMAYASALNKVFPKVYSYSHDQRSIQIPNYDPFYVCTAQNGNLSPSSYYMCHSGDLIPIFHTGGSGFRLPYRDNNDLAWMATVIDQFSAFIRTGDPAPSMEYLSARGAVYASTRARTTSSEARWTQLTASDQRQVSFGPVRQKMQTVAQKGDQCNALGKGIDYIARL